MASTSSSAAPGTTELQALVDAAVRDLVVGKAGSPERLLTIIQQVPADDEAEEDGKARENALFRLCDSLSERGDAQGLKHLLGSVQESLADWPRSKATKAIRYVLDSIERTPNSAALLVAACEETAEWCGRTKRTFLRQRVEARLADLLEKSQQYERAQKLLEALTKDVAKVDDKLMLLEVHLTQCRVFAAVRNTARAKAELTAAKTSANAIHVPPTLQAEIDLWSGILCAEEKDFETCFSYVFEAFESSLLQEAADSRQHKLDGTTAAGGSASRRRAIAALHMMLLAKVMHPGHAAVVRSLLQSKSAQEFADDAGVLLLADVAEACVKRSLEDLETCFAKHAAALGAHPRLAGHLRALKSSQLEQNIAKLCEPYSRVELAHLAHKMKLETVADKVSEMILDGKLAGQIDEGAGILELFDPAEESDEKQSAQFKNVVSLIENMGGVCDALGLKVEKMLQV